MKKFGGPKFGPKGSKSGAKLGFFCHFLKIASLVFLEIVCNDSLQQCLTSSWGKIHQNDFWVQICAKGAKGAKVRPGTSFFFVIFLRFGSLVFLEIAYNDSLQQCLTSRRSKTHEQTFWGPTFSQNRPKPGPKLVF